MLLPLLAGLLAEGKCTSVDCVQQQSMNEAVTKMDTITTEFVAAQEKVDTTYHADLKVDNDVAYQDPRIEKMRYDTKRDLEDTSAREKARVYAAIDEQKEFLQGPNDEAANIVSSVKAFNEKAKTTLRATHRAITALSVFLSSLLDALVGERVANSATLLTKVELYKPIPLSKQKEASARSLLGVGGSVGA